MQTYINQLLEMLHEAKGNRPGPSYIELPEEMEALRDIIELEKSMEEGFQTMESIFGVPQMYFPPEDKLNDEQIRQVTAGILDLWEAFHYAADFREGEFNDRERYTKLVEKWKETAPIFRGSNGIWHIEMYNYEDDWEDFNEPTATYNPEQDIHLSTSHEEAENEELDYWASCTPLQRFEGFHDLMKRFYSFDKPNWSTKKISFEP